MIAENSSGQAAVESIGHQLRIFEAQLRDHLGSFAKGSVQAPTFLTGQPGIAAPRLTGPWGFPNLRPLLPPPPPPAKAPSTGAPPKEKGGETAAADPTRAWQRKPYHLHLRLHSKVDWP